MLRVKLATEVGCQGWVRFSINFWYQKYFFIGFVRYQFISSSVSIYFARYSVPAALYEQMLDALDEKDLVQLITERQNQPLREVDLNQYL